MTAESVVTEESPLFASASTAEPGPETVLRHDLLYQRFSPSRKRFIVGLIAYAALIPGKSLNYYCPRWRADVQSVRSFGLGVVYTLHPRDRQRTQYHWSRCQASLHVLVFIITM